MSMDPQLDMYRSGYILDELAEEVFQIMHGKRAPSIQIKSIRQKGKYLDPSEFRMHNIGVEGVKINVLADGLGRKLQNTIIFDRGPHSKP